MEEVLCDVAPLEFCDVLLGQLYLWKHHVVYGSIPCTIILTFGKKLYNIQKVSPPTTILWISTNKCSNIISQTWKKKFFLIRSQSKGNIVATSMTPKKGSSIQ